MTAVAVLDEPFTRTGCSYSASPALRNQASTVPFTFIVIGCPRRSSALPTGTRTQPSLMQYSSTLVRSTPLKRMPMPRSSADSS
jgi:hypothetical protein